MNQIHIDTRMKKLFLENLKIDDEQYHRDARLAVDLGADSLDHVELVLAMEEEFDIEIDDAEIENIMTVHDAIALVGARLQEKHTPRLQPRLRLV